MAGIGSAGEHVQDGPFFEVPRILWEQLPSAVQGSHPGQIALPNFGTVTVFGHTFSLQVTRFMVLELVAAALMLAIFIPLARRLRQGGPPRGRFWNLIEVLVVFVRDEVVRPAIGHGADAFLPFLWNVFFFILFCNLLGLLPWAGSPTGSLAATAALAVCAFAAVVGAGMKHNGAAGYWIHLVPRLGVHWTIGIFLWPVLFAIELLGLAIRHLILAVRLLANMFAGHLVVAVIVSFIVVTWGTAVWWGVMPASVLGAAALNLLELFVAFLQAYIFTFLTAMFIGMAVHQH